MSPRSILFDGALLGERAVEKLLHILPRKSIYNIFNGTQFAPYGLLSPHLIPLTTGPVVKNWAPALLRHMNGTPAVSFIDANADAQAVTTQLSWLAQAETDDGMELYCRFADTRVAPSLIGTLDEEQFAMLGQCIYEWRIVNRHGRLDTVLRRRIENCEMTAGDRDPRPLIQLRLSDDQFVRMMQAAESDEIFHMLCEGTSDLVPSDNRGDFFFRLLKLVQSAATCGLQTRKDIYQFCVVGLATSDEFYRAPELGETWSRVRGGVEEFSNAVASWSDETWDLLPMMGISNRVNLGSC